MMMPLLVPEGLFCMDLNWVADPYFNYKKNGLLLFGTWI
jgi:hypothetical protein